jgi:hypothetical protein
MFRKSFLNLPKAVMIAGLRCPEILNRRRETPGAAFCLYATMVIVNLSKTFVSYED